MISAYLAYQFAGLWPLVWHFGLGGVLVLACGLLYAFTPAWLSKFFPNVQKILLWVATIIVTIMISTAIGVSLGEKRIQAQWDAAKANSLALGKQAHDNAVRDVARKPRRWLPNKPDGYNRDGH